MASPTGTYSNWSWPPASNSFEWTLQIERDPTTDGYYWAHQFGFAGRGGSYFGLQAHGSYRPDPGGNVVVITKMLVFAIADSVALDAELGDIPGPNARVENDFDGGSGWNIHMRYAWEPCHVYALRVGIRDVETNGDQWYGAGSETSRAATKSTSGESVSPHRRVARQPERHVERTLRWSRDHDLRGPGTLVRRFLRAHIRQRCPHRDAAEQRCLFHRPATVRTPASPGLRGSYGRKWESPRSKRKRR
ncbi:MAG: hypothetical protein R3A78_06890 [Polyangiales bacterium]